MEYNRRQENVWKSQTKKGVQRRAALNIRDVGLESKKKEGELCECDRGYKREEKVRMKARV